VRTARAALSAFLLGTAVLGMAADLPTGESFEGETLEYAMSWGIFSGGEMTITTSSERRFHGRPAYRIELTALSNDFISRFFVVRDSIVSWVDARTLESLRYEKHTVEGKHVRDERIEFDPERGIADRNGQEIPFDRPAFDSLSSVFYLRTQPLEPGRTIELEVVSGKRAYPLECEIGGRERVETPAGPFETIRVHPRMKEDGLLKKGADLWIWFTDDERRLPVVIRSKLNFGTLTARLARRPEPANSSAR
jgi:hypothetical protein